MAGKKRTIRQAIAQLDQMPETADPFSNKYKAPSVTGAFGAGVKTGINVLQGGGYGLIGELGALTGAEGVQRFGERGYNEQMRQAAQTAPTVNRFEDVNNLREGAMYAAGQLGQLAPMAATSVVSGGIGGKLARRGAARTERALTREAAEQATEVGTNAGLAANSIGTETGLIYGDINQQTGESRPGVALLAGAAAGGLDVLPQIGIARKLHGKGAGGGLVRGVLKQAGEEAATEGAQEVIEQGAVAAVDPTQQVFDAEGRSDILNSAIAGALGGGAIAGITHPLHGRAHARPQAVQESDAAQPEQRQQQQAASGVAPDEQTEPQGFTRAATRTHVEPRTYRAWASMIDEQWLDHANRSTNAYAREAAADIRVARDARLGASRREKAAERAAELLRGPAGDAELSINVPPPRVEQLDQGPLTKGLRRAGMESTSDESRIIEYQPGADAGNMDASRAGQEAQPQREQPEQRGANTVFDQATSDEMARIPLTREGAERVQQRFANNGIESEINPHANMPSRFSVRALTPNQRNNKATSADRLRDVQQAGANRGMPFDAADLQTEVQAQDAGDTLHLQNRDRSRPESIVQMRSIANSPDFDRLGQSPTPDFGAPLVSSKGNTASIPADQIGNEQNVTFADGSKIKARYAVVNADSVLASNDVDGAVNPAYYEPAKRGQLRALNNGRTAGLQSAYRRGTADNYRKGLARQAEKLGIDPESFTDVSKPMLVRLYDDNANVRADIGQASNVSQSAGLSPTEEAMNDARFIDVTKFDPDSDIDGQGNRGFVTAFIGNVPENERNGFTLSDGSPSKKVLDRIQAALIARAYDDPNIVSLAAEGENSPLRNVLNAVTMAAGEFAKVDRDAPLNMAPAVVEAAHILQEGKRRGLKPVDTVDQQDVMGRSKDGELVARFMAENIRSPKRVAEGLKEMARFAQREEMAQAQEGLFSRDDSTAVDLYRAVNDHLRQDYGDQAALISVPQATADAGNAASGDTGGQPAGQQRTESDQPGAAADNQGTQQSIAAPPDTGMPQQTTEPGQAPGSLFADEGEQQDEFGLTPTTPAGLQAEDDATAAAQAEADVKRKAAEDKAQADRERDSFTLTGSNADADQAMAAGQESLLGNGGVPSKQATGDVAPQPQVELSPDQWTTVRDIESRIRNIESEPIHSPLKTGAIYNRINKSDLPDSQKRRLNDWVHSVVTSKGQGGARERLEINNSATTLTGPKSAEAPSQQKMPPDAADYGAGNTFITKDKYEELKAQMRARLGRLNAGFDPELFGIGSQMAAFHIEAGARKFNDYARAMLSDLGDGIRPYLKLFYNGARDFPGFDNSGMDSYEAVRGIDENAIGVESATEPQAEKPAFDLNNDNPPQLTVMNATKALLDSARELPKNSRETKKWMASLYDDVQAKDISNAALKRAQEQIEAGIAQHLGEFYQNKEVAKTPERAQFAQFVDVYENQPALNVRTSKSVANQAYSTPAPIAFLAAHQAGAWREGVTLLEPTAGTGMLVAGRDPQDRGVRLNEIDPYRARLLRAEGFDATERDATDADLGSGYDVVVTNPPFGSLRKATGDKARHFDSFKLTKLDHVIAANALEAMANDGRGTIIIGASREAGTRGEADRIFQNWLYSHYNVTDHYELNGDLYSRQGAGWPVALITVDGRRASETFAPDMETVPRYNSWDEAYQHYVSTKPESKPALGSESQRGTRRRNDAGAHGVTNAEGRRGDIRGAAGGQAGRTNRGVSNSGRGGTGRGRDGSESSIPAGGRREGAGAQSGGPAGNAGRHSDSGLGKQPGQDNASGAGARSPGRANTGRDTRGAVDRDADVSASEFQVPYQPESEGSGDGILIPHNLAHATEQSLHHLADRVGNLDDYVMEKLGYESREDLHSALMGIQVDAVAQAIDQIENKKAAVIADQTGVGKGRQAAAILTYARRHELTPIFITEKPDLFTSMYDDLADIGVTGAKPFIVNDGELIKHNGKKLFKSKGRKRKDGLAAMQSGEMPADSDMIFATYSQFSRPNVQQEAMQGIAPNAVLVMDESHNAAGDSARGAYFRELLGQVQGAIYLSATFAKRPDSMPLYFRTDLGDSIDDVDALIEAMVNGGVPLQTVVSNMLAQSGQLFRRERSYEGVEIATQVDTANREAHEAISDELTGAMRRIIDADKSFSSGQVKMMDAEAKAQAKRMRAAGNNARGSVDHTNFTSVVHNIIAQMLLATKADTAADAAIKALQSGEKPVIGLENTFGSFLDRYAGENGLTAGDLLDGYDFRAILSRALERTRRVQVTNPNGTKETVDVPYAELTPETRRLYDTAQATIDDIGDATLKQLQVSPIDWIRYRLEQAGYRSKEITGRSQRVDFGDDGVPRLAAIDPEEKDKVLTRDGFNNGDVDALIINVAGASGINLHASENFSDQRQRHMIIAQPMRDINAFVQMLGRIHRTGQVKLPRYTILSLDLPTEKRPTAVLSRKMKSLNANTTANDESETSVDAPDILNKYGDLVVQQYLKENADVREFLDIAGATSGTEDTALPDLAMRATGRMALMTTRQQLEFYDEVEAAYNAKIEYLNKTGQNDLVAQTLDLDAAPPDEQITLVEGKDPSTVFGRDANLGLYDSKAQGKPPTWEDVTKATEASLGGQRPAEYVDAIISSKDSAFSPILAHAKENIADAEKSAETAVTAKQKAAAQEMVDTAKARLENLMQEADQQREALRDMAPGTVHSLQVGDEQYNGVVTQIRNLQKGRGNPYAPSKTHVVFMVDGGMRNITLPMTQLVGSESIMTRSLLPKDEIQSAFENAANRNERESRWIATGNLVSGMSELGKGQIATFSMQQGGTQQGIVLPKSFDPARLSGDVVMRDPEAIYNLLADNSGNENVARFGVATRGRDGVRVLPRGNSGPGITIQVPKSKKAGGKYFLDDRLVQRTDDGFTSIGNRMEAAVSNKQDAVAAIQRLQEIKPLYAPAATAELAEKYKNRRAQGAANAEEVQDDASYSPNFDPKFLRGETPAQYRGAFVDTKMAGDAMARLRAGLMKAHKRGVRIQAVAPKPNKDGKAARGLQQFVHRAFDRDVVWFRSDDPVAPQGVTLSSTDNTVYVNVDSDFSLSRIAGHELVHSMRHDNPQAYAGLADIIRELSSDYDAYVRRVRDTYQSDGLAAPNAEALGEEFVADVVGAMWDEPGFMRELAAATEPSAFKRIANAILAWLGKVRAKLRGHKPGAFLDKHTSNAAAVRRAVLSGVADMARGDEIQAASTDHELVRRMVAWHGSPHDFDEFQLQAIGSGEGFQAYGWGLYFSSIEDVAQGYRERLALVGKAVVKGKELENQAGPLAAAVLRLHDDRGVTVGSYYRARDAEVAALQFRAEAWRDAGNSSKARQTDTAADVLKKSGPTDVSVRHGRLYKVNIAPKHDDFLQWYRPLSEQSEYVKNAMRKLSRIELTQRQLHNMDMFDKEELLELLLDERRGGEEIYGLLSDTLGSDRAASQYLGSVGIPGIAYLDGSSRARGEGSYNYVLFDDSLVSIDAKFSRRGQVNDDMDGAAQLSMLTPEGRPIAARAQPPGNTGLFDTSRPMGRLYGMNGLPYEGDVIDSMALDAYPITRQEAARLRPLGIVARFSSRGPDTTGEQGWFAIIRRSQLSRGQRGAVETTPRVASQQQRELIDSVANRERVQFVPRGDDGGYAMRVDYPGTEQTPLTPQGQPLFSRAGQATINAAEDSWRPGQDPAKAEAMRKAGLGWTQVSAPQRVGQSMQSWWDKTKATAMDRAREGLFDRFAPIKEQAGEAAYMGARLSTGASSTLYASLLYGAPTWKDGVISKKAGSQGLLDVLKPVKSEMNEWLGWMVGKRAEYLAKQGRENNMNEADIAALTQDVTGEKLQRFERVAKQFRMFNTDILRLSRDAGLLSDKQVKAFQMDRYYVPFYREHEDAATGEIEPTRAFTRRGLSHQQAGIKQLKGGDQALTDPLENVFANMLRLIDASLKNKAMHDAVQDVSDHSIIEPAPEGKRSDKNVVRVMNDGEAQYFRIHDPAFLRALNGIHSGPLGGLGAFRFFKRMLTLGVTADPSFMFRNYMRDSMHAWMLDKDGFDAGIDSLRGAKDVLKTIKNADAADPGLEAIMFSGASFIGGHAYGTDPQSHANALRRALRDKGMGAADIESHMSSIIDTPKRWWSAYREIGDAMENANRLAMYRSAINAGRSNLEAVYASKDLQDFSLQGNFTFIRVMTDMLPFFNARLQGMYRLGRGFNDDPMKIARRGGIVAMASLALAIANGQNDDYNALPEWEKDTYWHLYLPGGKHLRIPKPFELGILFGTLPERLMRAGGGLDTPSESLASLQINLGQILAFDPTPQIINPALETYMNWDKFRDRPIENMGDRNRLPSARFNAFTSPTMVQIGQMVGMSPKKLEHLWGGYLGTLGMYVLGASDWLYRRARGDISPAMTVDDIPVLGSFVRNDNARSTKYASELYSALDEANQVYSTIRNYQKSGQPQRAQALLEGNQGLMQARHMLTSTSRATRKIRKRMDAVRDNDDLSAQQKRQRLDRMRGMVTQMQRRAVEATGVN